MKCYHREIRKERNCKMPDGISLKEETAEKQTREGVTKKDSEGEQKNYWLRKRILLLGWIL